MAQEPPDQGQPNTDYGSSPGPYETPQNPYNAPPNPYATPESPYNAPYGDSYGQGGAGYLPSASSPLPLGEAIRQLPGQWIRVITHPGAMTLAAESGKASWDITWVQLIISAVVSAILSFLVSLEGRSFVTLPSGTSGANAGFMNSYRYILGGASFASIITVPLFFFIGMGIYYGLAKAFGGQGRFLTQCYTFLLFGVPLGIISSLIALIPFAGVFIGFAVGVYEIVLDIFAVMAVHRLSGGKATAVILIPLGVLLLLFCALFAVLFFVLAAALQQTH